jgi:hypothetical protein
MRYFMTVWPGSMGKIDLKYYVLIKGRGYWLPTKRMKELGFSDIRCGPDGPAAWKIAADWNERWQKCGVAKRRPQRRCRFKSSPGSKPN